MTIRYPYTKTEPHKIPAALDTFFAALEGADKSFSRAANFNLIIPLSSSAKLEELEDEIDAFSFVHPSRFFVL
jgi:hypothetical protein